MALQDNMQGMNQSMTQGAMDAPFTPQMSTPDFNPLANGGLSKDQFLKMLQNPAFASMLLGGKGQQGQVMPPNMPPPMPGNMQQPVGGRLQSPYQYMGVRR